MRRSANPSRRETVKTSVPLPADVWQRLCSLAALRQQNRGEVAAAILRQGLKHISIRVNGPLEAEQDGPPAAGQGGPVE